ncbi:MAG: hypothetical protein U0353_31540 [Sandaracinus sp.]
MLTLQPDSWSAPGGSIVIDERHSPVIWIRFFGVPSPTDFEAYLGALSRRLDREVRSVTVLDLTHSTGTSMDSTRAQARWIADNRARLQRYGAATIFVFPSPGFRFALAALLAISPLPGIFRVVGTADEATSLANELVSTQRLALHGGGEL